MEAEYSHYKCIELKAVLRALKQKTTGTKNDLIARLLLLDAQVVENAFVDLEKEDWCETRDDAVDEVAGLRAVVEQLSAEVRALRASSYSPNMWSANACDVLPVVTSEQIFPTSARSVHDVQLVPIPCVQPTVRCTAVPMQADQSITSHVWTTTTTQSSVSMTQPMIMTMAQPLMPTGMRSAQSSYTRVLQPNGVCTNNLQYATTSGQAGFNMWSPINEQHVAPTPMAGQQHSLREISSVIPSFDPSDESSSSVQFVEKIEQLKTAYGWNDAILIFAVLSKLDGVARRWADAQPVFHNWANFVSVFLNDFPCVRTQASAHMFLMKSKMNRGESIINYYYRMLALGRRDNIDDASIICYIINGLFDENMKRTLSAMQFRQCSDLLMSMQNMTSVFQVQNTWHKQVAGNSKDEKTFYTGKLASSQATKTDDGSKRQLGDVICFKCRQRGHIAKDCAHVREIRNITENNDIENNDTDKHTDGENG